MYQNNLLKKIEYALLNFFDTTAPRPMYKRFFGFALVVSLIILVLDVRISPEANITTLMQGRASIFTYVVLVAFPVSVVGFFSHQFYFFVRNWRPNLRRKKKRVSRPMVPSVLPTSWDDWKEDKD